MDTRSLTEQELLVNRLVMGRCNHPVCRLDETVEQYTDIFGGRTERVIYEAVCSSCRTRKYVRKDSDDEREPSLEDAQQVLRFSITSWFSDVITARIVLRKLNELGWQGGATRYRGKYRCTLKKGGRSLPLRHSDSETEAEAIGDAAASVARVLRKEERLTA